MGINGKTKLLGIFGNPVSHSKSPSLHNKWIDELNLNAAYVPFHVDNIEIAVKAIKEMNLVGVNVTVPYKEAVIPFLDELSDDAHKIGAVNTILNKNGRLIGYNTDYIGIESSIKEWFETSKSLLIIGAGGAAKSVAYLANKYSLNTSLINRTESKALELVQEFSLNGVLNENDSTVFDIIINTTSVGMDSKSLSFDLNKLTNKPKYVYDVIYSPEQTPFLKRAEELNILNMNGKDMLINQAKASFSIWKEFLPLFN